MHRDQLPIAEPCHADWGAMSGDERRRFCSQCSKHVHDLSALRPREAEALVASEADLCVRYEVDADGAVVHRRGRRARLAAAAGALLAAASPALASPAPADPDAGPSLLERASDAVRSWLAPETTVVLGEMAPVPEEVEPEPVDDLQTETPWTSGESLIPELDAEVTVPPVVEPPRVRMGKIKMPSRTPPLTEPVPVDDIE